MPILTDTTLEVFAFTAASNAPKTGDAVNITAYVSIDGGAVTQLADTSAAEVDSANAAGFYRFSLTTGERNGSKFIFTAKSSTSGVVVVVPGIPFRSSNFSPNYAYVTAGSSSPAVAGVFTVFGTQNGQLLYTNSDLGAQLSYSGTRWELFIAGAPGSLWILAGTDANGTYTASTGATGSPVVQIHGSGTSSGVTINVGNSANAGIITVGS